MKIVRVGHWQHPESGSVFNPGDIVEIPERLFKPQIMDKIQPETLPEVIQPVKVTSLEEKPEEVSDDTDIIITDAEVSTEAKTAEEVKKKFIGIDPAGTKEEDKKPEDPKADPKKQKKKKK